MIFVHLLLQVVFWSRSRNKVHLLLQVVGPILEIRAGHDGDDYDEEEKAAMGEMRGSSFYDSARVTAVQSRYETGVTGLKTAEDDRSMQVVASLEHTSDRSMKVIASFDHITDRSIVDAAFHLPQATCSHLGHLVTEHS